MNFNNEDKRIIKRNSLTLIIGIIVIVSLMNIGPILKVFGYTWKIIFPFILGVGIAFIINIPMNAIERGLIDKTKIKSRSVKRGVSILISLILIFGLLTLLISKILPQFINSLASLIRQTPYFIDDSLAFMRSFDFLESYANNIEKFIQEINLEDVGRIALNFLTEQQIAVEDMGNILSNILSIISGFTNLFIALVFAIYCLASKEKLIRQAKEVVYTFFKEKHGDKIVHIANVLRLNFHNFFTGQFLEAMVLGTLNFIGMAIIGLPFAPLVSTIIGFGALIPIFGAIIAAFIGALVIMIESPIQALIFLIFIITLQQIDGNFIYPRIVGKQVGLPSMWVLAGITIGGSMFGVVGMLISVPIFSTVYVLLKEYENKTLEEKDIDIREK